MTIADRLYRPRTDLPDDAERHRFAGVDVAVTITDTDPATAAAQWSADRDIALTMTDDVPADDVTAVVTEFLAFAATRTDGRDTWAGVSAASRDVDRAAAIRAAGVTPAGILAVADLGRESVPTPSGGPVVRDAGADDAEAVARLWWEQAEYEARVGTLRVSDAIRAAIAAELPGVIAGDSVVLVAEDAGVLVGAVVAEPPAASEWSATRLTLAPVSYLAMASTSTERRGSGVGRALVAELHRRHRTAGLAASTLHYSAYNPLSIPFWSRQGYRPLVTHYSRHLE